jgi:hypothetical protein
MMNQGRISKAANCVKNKEEDSNNDNNDDGNNNDNNNNDDNNNNNEVKHQIIFFNAHLEYDVCGMFE